MKTIGCMGFGRTGSERRDHRIYFRGIGVTIDKGVGDAIIIDKYRDERARTQLRKGRLHNCSLS